MTLSIKEYDKVVRKFVDDYVNNLTPDQLREIVSEQSHIDFENIRQDCLLYTSPSPRDLSTSRMPSSA